VHAKLIGLRPFAPRWTAGYGSSEATSVHQSAESDARQLDDDDNDEPIPCLLVVVCAARAFITARVATWASVGKMYPEDSTILIDPMTLSLAEDVLTIESRNVTQTG
jgi:hypothetical protein